MKKTTFYLPKYLILLSAVGIFAVIGLYRKRRTTAPFLEGLNEMNNAYVYYPKYPKLEPKFSYKINDVSQEAIDVLTFLKSVYFPLQAKPMTPRTNGSREYAGKIMNSEIYNQYNKIVSQSTNILDQVWKPFFRANTLNENNVQQFHDEFLSYSRDYAQLTHVFMQSPHKDHAEKPDIYAWVNYLIRLMNYYKSSQTHLDKIKEWVYKIIFPIEHYTKFVYHYIDNIKSYSSKDDALFVINITIELIKQLELESMLHDQDGYLYIFQEEVGMTPEGTPVKPINIQRVVTVDGLTLYSVAVMMKMYYSVIQSVVNTRDFVHKYKTYLVNASKPSNTLLLTYIHSTNPDAQTT
jgi:hypothetical protein